jgi:hypothetical protein
MLDPKGQALEEIKERASELEDVSYQLVQLADLGYEWVRPYVVKVRRLIDDLFAEAEDKLGPDPQDVAEAAYERSLELG